MTTPPERPLPEPTDARRGSAAKLRVMCQRWRAGEQLFHPLDNPDIDPGATHIEERACRLLPVGITWVWQRRKWRARIVDVRTGERVSLGLFESLDDAVEAVRVALTEASGS